VIGDIIASVFLLAGAGLCLLAGIGLHRFDDVFARMHIATKPPTLGLILLSIGVGIEMAGHDIGSDAKLVLIVLLALVTAPTAAQMMGRAAYRSGNELAPSTVLDELADHTPGSANESNAPDAADDHT
jgi:multicomponent Na+:H+ antiporter subunit G